jgi:hypothetical protein
MWVGFLDGLHAFDQARSCKVQLAAMSPADYHLTVMATDRDGH